MGGFWQFFGLPDPAEGQRTRPPHANGAACSTARRRTDARQPVHLQRLRISSTWAFIGGAHLSCSPCRAILVA